MSNGVAIPLGQLRPTRRVDPWRVINAHELTPVAVEYSDGRGEIITELWYRLGNDYYQPKDSEVFVSSFKRVTSEKLLQQMAATTARQAVNSENIQKQVDKVAKIIGEQMAAQQEVDV